LGLTRVGSLLPQCGRRVGDEGKLTLLIAVGGRAKDLLWAKERAAKAPNAVDRCAREALRELSAKKGCVRLVLRHTIAHNHLGKGALQEVKIKSRCLESG